MLSPVRRWAVALGVTAVVLLAPQAPRLLPARGDADVDTATLLARVQAAPDQAWSGYVETAGTVQLPASGDLDDVGALLGEQNRLRVWWEGPQRWRVDRLLTAGETDLVKRGPTVVSYSYEAQRASVYTDPDIRLPRTSDLVPVELARLLLAGARPDEVTALAPRTVAGVDAAGLRLSREAAGADRSTVDHVDVWADPATGVPLQVEVWATGSSAPAVTSEVVDYDAGSPPVGAVAFDATPTTEVVPDDVLDIADAASRYAPLRPPARVAGLARTADSSGAVGVYGSGLTRLVAVPLRDREAQPLRDQVRRTPGVVARPASNGVTVGPLTVLVTGGPGDGGWLVAGTLEEPALRRAGRDLLAGAVYTGEPG